MSKSVIDLKAINKIYRLGTHVGGRNSLVDVIKHKYFHTQKASDEYLHALSDIDLNIESGEKIGLIGKNGSGKSTLLKIINRVSAPSSGVCRTRGRVGSLLEVGAGFYGELTGRENLYVVGTILGMYQNEIKEQLHNIFQFSELDPRLIDTPVKRYSSGQYMRLAFAISAHLKSEILLVDEVLAVGDQAFQNKCISKLRSLANDGRAVIFVSHQLSLVADLCTRVIWLDKGRIVMDGETDHVLSEYRRATTSSVEMSGWIRCEDIRITNARGDNQITFSVGDEVLMNCVAHTKDMSETSELQCRVWHCGLWDDKRLVTAIPVNRKISNTSAKLKFRLPGLLGPGTYEIHLVAIDHQGTHEGASIVFHVKSASDTPDDDSDNKISPLLVDFGECLTDIVNIE